MINSLKTEEESSSVKEAIQMSQETAQSIYTFLTPLAAAVTAFFFDANGLVKMKIKPNHLTFPLPLPADSGDCHRKSSGYLNYYVGTTSVLS